MHQDYVTHTLHPMQKPPGSRTDKVPMLIVLQWVFLKLQITEHMGENGEKHHTEPYELKPAGIFCPYSLLRSFLPPKNTCVIFFKSSFKLV